MAEIMDEELYYSVRSALAQSFMKVPNRTLAYQRNFKEFTSTPLPLPVLTTIYRDRLAEAMTSVEHDGMKLNPKVVGYLERIQDILDELPSTVSMEDVEGLLEHSRTS